MYDADVCSQCDCLLPGVQNMQTDCEKVSVELRLTIVIIIMTHALVKAHL